MIPSIQLDNWAEKMNANNIIQYYKDELLSLKKGKKIVSTIPLGTRKMLLS